MGSYHPCSQWPWKGKHIVEYYSEITKLDAKLEDAGNTISALQRKRALLPGLPKDYSATREAIMSVEQNYNQAISKFIVWELRLRDSESTQK